MRVNICGIPHKIIECDDNFTLDLHMGEIEYSKCQIKVNKNMTPEMQKESICHKMVHGMLLHLGYNNLTQDEQLVQALGNAIYQGFEIKKMEE